MRLYRCSDAGLYRLLLLHPTVFWMTLNPAATSAGAAGLCPGLSTGTFVAMVIDSCSGQSASGLVTLCPLPPWHGGVAWGNGMCAHRAALAPSCQQTFCASGHLLLALSNTCLSIGSLQEFCSPLVCRRS